MNDPADEKIRTTILNGLRCARDKSASNAEWHREKARAEPERAAVAIADAELSDRFAAAYDIAIVAVEREFGAKP